MSEHERVVNVKTFIWSRTGKMHQLTTMEVCDVLTRKQMTDPVLLSVTETKDPGDVFTSSICVSTSIKMSTCIKLFLNLISFGWLDKLG